MRGRTWIDGLKDKALLRLKRDKSDSIKDSFDIIANSPTVNELSQPGDGHYQNNTNGFTLGKCKAPSRVLNILYIHKSRGLA